MEKLLIFIKTVIPIIGGAAGWFWGGWSSGLVLLVVLSVADYISGCFAAGYERKLNSRIGYKGIAKKVMLFCLVGVAYQLDVFIADITGGAQVIYMAVLFFYMSNELLSLTENAGRLDLPVPDVLVKAVEVLKNKGGSK